MEESYTHKRPPLRGWKKFWFNSAVSVSFVVMSYFMIRDHYYNIIKPLFNWLFVAI